MYQTPTKWLQRPSDLAQLLDIHVRGFVEVWGWYFVGRDPQERDQLGAAEGIATTKCVGCLLGRIAYGLGARRYDQFLRAEALLVHTWGPCLVETLSDWHEVGHQIADLPSILLAHPDDWEAVIQVLDDMIVAKESSHVSDPTSPHPFTEAVAHRQSASTALLRFPHQRDADLPIRSRRTTTASAPPSATGLEPRSLSAVLRLRQTPPFFSSPQPYPARYQGDEGGLA